MLGFGVAPAFAGGEGIEQRCDLLSYYLDAALRRSLTWDQGA